MTNSDRKDSARAQRGGPAPRFNFTVGGIQRTLLLATLILTAVTGFLVSVVMKSYVKVTETSTFDGSIETTSSVVGSLGLPSLILALIPVVLALVPLVLSGGARQAAGWTAAVLLTAFCVLGGFSVGMFYVPAAMLMWAAMLVPVLVLRQGQPRRFSPWRLVGGVLVVLPVIVVLLGALSGSIWIGPGFWFVALLLAVLAVVFALGINYTSQIVLVLGVAFLLFSAFDGGMLTLGIWLTAGLWLVVGLVALPTEQVRR